MFIFLNSKGVPSALRQRIVSVASKAPPPPPPPRPGTRSPDAVHLAHVMAPPRLPKLRAPADEHPVAAGLEAEVFGDDGVEEHRDSFPGAQGAAGKHHDVTIRPGLPAHPCVHTDTHTLTHEHARTGTRPRKHAHTARAHAWPHTCAVTRANTHTAMQSHGCVHARA